MLVDDSAVVRGLVARWLADEPDFAVVASVSNGLLAVRNVRTCGAEIAVLDIEMPVMDGIDALPRMLAEVPDLRVVMSSTLTRKGAEITVKAMQLGAADYVAKPEARGDLAGSDAFKRELIGKLRALGQSHRGRRPAPGATRPAPFTAAAQARSAPSAFRAAHDAAGGLSLRRPGRARPAVLAIGSSTGGPQALFRFFTGLGGPPTVPVVITQHMPPAFTAILAEHLSRISGIHAAEARDGDVLEAGKVFVAPGDHHMTIVSDGLRKTIRLDQGAPENFCRPAVDPMFRSLAAAYGPAVLALVLTGMGQDGLLGGRVLVDAGATIVAQDEASSVVWGMPGAVANAGLCAAVEPIEALPRVVSRLLAAGGAA